MSIGKEYANICENIRYLRLRHGLSRTAMARRLHITSKTLDLLEAGVFPDRIRIDFLFLVQQVFGVPPKQLLTCRLAQMDMEAKQKPPVE